VCEGQNKNQIVCVLAQRAFGGAHFVQGAPGLYPGVPPGGTSGWLTKITNISQDSCPRGSTFTPRLALITVWVGEWGPCTPKAVLTPEVQVGCQSWLLWVGQAATAIPVLRSQFCGHTPESRGLFVGGLSVLCHLTQALPQRRPP
jgi:hypothetical protein